VSISHYFFSSDVEEDSHFHVIYCSSTHQSWSAAAVSALLHTVTNLLFNPYVIAISHWISQKRSTLFVTTHCYRKRLNSVYPTVYLTGWLTCCSILLVRLCLTNQADKIVKPCSRLSIVRG